MIEIKGIRRENNKILCEAFVEDSTQAISIIYDILKDCFDEGDLPAGYEDLHDGKSGICPFSPSFESVTDEWLGG